MQKIRIMFAFAWLVGLAGENAAVKAAAEDEQPTRVQWNVIWYNVHDSIISEWGIVETYRAPSPGTVAAFVAQRYGPRFQFPIKISPDGTFVDAVWRRCVVSDPDIDRGGIAAASYYSGYCEAEPEKNVLPQGGDARFYTSILKPILEMLACQGGTVYDGNGWVKALFYGGPCVESNVGKLQKAAEDASANAGASEVFQRTLAAAMDFHITPFPESDIERGNYKAADVVPYIQKVAATLPHEYQRQIVLRNRQQEARAQIIMKPIEGGSGRYVVEGGSFESSPRHSLLENPFFRGMADFSLGGGQWITGGPNSPFDFQNK